MTAPDWAPRPAVIDANVLFSATVRDLLIRCHIAGLLRIHWTDRILDETFMAIARQRPGLEADRLRRTRQLMNEAARGANITHLVVEDFDFANVVVPDENDLHVVRAAASIQADVVTWNLADFPPTVIDRFGITAVSPDTYLDSNVVDPELFLRIVAQQAHDLRTPPTTVEMLLGRFDNQGLCNFVSRLRGHG